MLNIAKKSFKISFFQKTGLLLAAFFLLFFSSGSHTTYAQYAQINSYGNIYTYVNNPSNITTAGTTNVTSSGAVISGLVNGNNLYNTYNLETWFQYGTSTNLGYSTVHNPSNTGYANFNATLGSLSPNTIYYYRAVGQNPQGIIYGGINSFRTNYSSVIYGGNDSLDNSANSYTTLSAITSPATSITSSGAKLNSTIFNPNSDGSTTWFEYGTTVDLGSSTNPVSTGGLPSVKHVNTLRGLSPHTTYYFRAVVANPSNKNVGSVLSFITNYGTKSSTTSKITSTDTITKTTTNESPSYLNALGANVFGAGSFFPINIFGWLILIILVLIVVLLCKHPHVRFWGDNSTTTHEDPHI